MVLGGGPLNRPRAAAWILGGASLALAVGLGARGAWSLAPLPLGAALGAAAFLALAEATQEPDRVTAAPRTRARELATWAALVMVLALSYGATVTAAPFTVPLVVDLLAGAGAALLAWDALCARDAGDRQRVALRIGAFWAVLLIERQLPFSRGITSPDIGAHLTTMLQPLLDTGRIPVGASYSSFPMHHVLVVALDRLSGLGDVRHAYAIAGTAIALTLPLLLVRSPDDAVSRRGLWTGLLAGAAAYAFNVLSHPSALSFALPAAVLLIEQAARPRSGRWPLFILAPLALVAFFTHPYSTAILLAILAAVVLVRSASAGRSPLPWRNVAIAIGVGVALFLVVLQVSGLVRLVSEYLARVTATGGSIPGGVVGNFYDQLPAPTLALNWGPLVLFLALAASGWLFAIGNVRAHATTLALSVLLVVPIALGLLGLPLTFPDRWYVYLEVVVLLPLAALAMARLVRASPGGAIAVCAILLAFAPATIVAGAEGSPLSRDVLHMRTFFVEQETVAESWALAASAATTPHVRVYAAPGFLHERTAALALESYDPPDGEQLRVIHTPRPALVLTSRLATVYGVPTSFLPGDRIGGTILTPLRYDEMEESPLIDRVYVNDGASVYQVRSAPP